MDYFDYDLSLVDRLKAGEITAEEFEKLHPMGRRTDMCKTYSWAIPTEEALQVLVEFSPIVEMGAGTGYWAALATDRGADVLAFDLHPPPSEANHWHRETKMWFPVSRGGVPRVRIHTKRTLFLCWPPYASDFADRCLRSYRGQHVIYVGEGFDGCTGDDRFHWRLEREWSLIREVDIPQWWGIHDRMYVYRRKA